MVYCILGHRSVGCLHVGYAFAKTYHRAVRCLDDGVRVALVAVEEREGVVGGAVGHVNLAFLDSSFRCIIGGQLGPVVACGVGILEQHHVGKIILLGTTNECRGERYHEVTSYFVWLTRSLNLHPTVIGIMIYIWVVRVRTFGIAVVNASVLVHIRLGTGIDKGLLYRCSATNREFQLVAVFAPAAHDSLHGIGLSLVQAHNHLRKLFGDHLAIANTAAGISFNTIPVGNILLVGCIA